MRFSKIHRWLTKNFSFVVNDDEIIVAQCALYVMLMQLSMKRVFLYWTAWFDQYLDIFLIISSETDRQIVWRRIYEKKNHSWIFRTIGAAWRDLLQRWWWFRAFATVRCVVADCGRRVQLLLLRASSIIAFHAIKSIGCGSKIIVPTNTRTGQIQLSMRSVFAPRRHSVKNDHAEFRLESGTSIEQPPQTPMTYKLPYEMERLYSATECERFLNADGWIIHRSGYTTRPVMII